MSSTEFGALDLTLVLDRSRSILPEDFFETHEELNEFIKDVYEHIGLEVKKGYQKYFPATLHRNTYDSLFYYWTKKKAEVRIKSFDKDGTPPRTWDGKALSSKQKKQWQSRYMALAKGSEVNLSAFESMQKIQRNKRQTGVMASRMTLGQKKVDSNAVYSLNTFNNMFSKKQYEKYARYGTFAQWSVEYVNKKGQTKHKKIWVAESLSASAYKKRLVNLGDEIGYRWLDKVELASRPESLKWRNFLYENGSRIISEGQTLDAICKYIDEKCQKMLEEKAK